MHLRVSEPQGDCSGHTAQGLTHTGGCCRAQGTGVPAAGHTAQGTGAVAAGHTAQGLTHRGGFPFSY